MTATYPRVRGGLAALGVSLIVGVGACGSASDDDGSPITVEEHVSTTTTAPPGPVEISDTVRLVELRAPSAPALENGRIIVTTAADLNGVVHVIDADSLEIITQVEGFPLDGTSTRWPPLIMGDELWIPGNDEIRRLSLSNFEDLGSLEVPGVGAIRHITADDSVVVAAGGERLVAIELSSGTPAWSLEYPGLRLRSPGVAIAAGAVIVGHEMLPEVSMLSVDDGSLTPLAGSGPVEFMTQPWPLDDGVVVAATIDEQAMVMLIDPSVPTVTWSTKLNTSLGLGNPSGHEGVIAVGAPYGVALIDQVAGNLLAEVDLPAPAGPRPVPYGTGFVVVDIEGGVAVVTRAGAVQEVTQLPGARVLANEFLVINRTAYISVSGLGSGTAGLYAVELPPPPA